MIVVTGGAGFIGSAMVAKLNREGVRDILVVDRLESGPKWRNLSGKRFEGVVHPEAFLERLPGEARGIEAIIHMGAISSTTETDGDRILQYNLEYTRTLALFAAERSIRFIYASSASTYGDGSLGFDDDPALLDKLRPMNLYGFSKHQFDLWARDKGLLSSIVGLKFFNVYGPNEYHKGFQGSVTFNRYPEVKRDKLMRLFKSYRAEYQDGEQKRDHIYVKDCADVMWWLLDAKGVNGVFNLGTGQGRSWNDLARALLESLGFPPRIEYIEMPEAIRPHYQYLTEAKMDRLLGAGCPVRLTPLEEGMREYVREYLEKDMATL